MSEAPRAYITSILNDIRRKFDSPEFEGGAVTSVLSRAEMDLRESKMKSAEAYLEVTNILGSIYIYPAEGWDIQLEIVEIAGRVKDHRKESKTGKGIKKLLHINGSTILGDVYLR